LIGNKKTAIALVVEVRSFVSRPPPLTSFLSALSPKITPFPLQRARAGPRSEVRRRNLLRDSGEEKERRVFFFFLFSSLSSSKAGSLSPSSFFHLLLTPALSLFLFLSFLSPPLSTNLQLALCLVQSTLVWWKKTHRRSYELVSLLGLWLVPAAISAR